MKTIAGPPGKGRGPDVLRYLGSALPEQWRRYGKRLKRCQQKFSEAAVHDSRIETRRLQAFVELLAAFIPEPQLKKPRRALKKHLDAFDRLRDTQVQLVCVARMRHKSRVAQEFQVWLRRREVRFIREARQAVKKIKTRRLGKSIAAFERELRCQRETIAPARTFMMAQAAIRTAFARVGRLCCRVKATDTATIHRTRIAFKRFRYMVEALFPLLPAVTDKQLQAMHGYQSIMGDIQDLNVLLVALDKYVEQEDMGAAAQRLRTAIGRRQAQLVRFYLNAAPKLWSFWPPEKMSTRSPTDQNNQP